MSIIRLRNQRELVITALLLAVGVGYFIAMWVGGDPRAGLRLLALMAFGAVATLVGRRRDQRRG